MIENGYEATKIFGKSLLLLDRYFLSVPALECLKQCNSIKTVTMYLVTKAKKSSTAYEQPTTNASKCVRSAKKGKTRKSKELFSEKSNKFIEVTINLYGKQEKVHYYCTNYLWGQKLYQELRFVLVEYNGIQSILVSTDLTLNPFTIIHLYSQRFKIECTFHELKQCIGGFSYQFWSKSMPKLKCYLKKRYNRNHFVFTNRIESCCIRGNSHVLFTKKPNLNITRFIIVKQEQPAISEDLQAS